MNALLIIYGLGFITLGQYVITRRQYITIQRQYLLIQSHDYKMITSIILKYGYLNVMIIL